ncbi:hypothetical protein LTR09_001406 [Extremus antarcticus]|uniref:Uncharacterized protein n=1 Tax=Extremus antarcticus TaxID=702011 RepID=A0AAJ0LWZ1_9PEZI|nr:hypothetical protein LTR09_001406 [Extremus antarcticus]
MLMVNLTSPESPRWMVHEELFEEARLVVAQTNSNSREDDVSLAVYKEIVDTLKFEKEFICGNIIASYYLGAELDSAGITDSLDQLKANVVLNVFCLFTSLLGTYLCANWGRKSTALLAQCLLVVCLFIIGGLTKLITDTGDNASLSIKYGDVATMFLFQGIYSIAWTPLLYLYPPEVMNYSIRANGLAFSQFMLNAFAVVFVFIMPIALGNVRRSFRIEGHRLRGGHHPDNIGWKTYILNGSWDVIIVALIALFWVETKGKTLEEIDAIWNVKRFDLPDLEDVRTGKVTLDVKAVEQELEEIVAKKAD